MKNKLTSIVIVGSGRAALLHLNAYMKIWDGQESPQIFIIAGDVIEPEIKDIVKKHPWYIQFKELQQVIQLKQPESIIDVCTPPATHGNIVEKMADAGFFRFLVEKPLVTTIDDLERIKSKKVRVVTMQNYLFSQATERTLDLIRTNEIIPKSMVSFFCKDRTHESVMKRGFDGDDPPHVFTIELPHQLYLATEFMGPAKVEAAYAESMRTGNLVYLSHGTGVIYLEHPCSFSVHFSCLSSDTPIKCVVISDKNGQTLTMNFPITKRVLTSTIEIQDKTGSYRKEVFENDDMMKKALEYYYSILTSNTSDYSCYSSLDGALLVIDAIGKNSSVFQGRSIC